ncbi:hypothetical protein [Pseudobutyrivibrio sp. MD2005]|uniref:hypothetical protein n=1 Tax=Pseudobutyrivibrio sp. MD2005 TaxID=1410616 RepID=UPI00047FCF07|nr:hypothetical protein [Pseudobutyrivibrio sp. MD2005]
MGWLFGSKKTTLEQKREEHINKRREEMQQSQDFFFNYANLDAHLESEANEAVTEQSILAAEKEAGLEQKKIPQQEIPEEVMNQIEAEHTIINNGKKMTWKDRRSAKKNYKKKINRVKKAQKINDSFNNYLTTMKDSVKDIATDIAGKNVADNARLNYTAAILINTFNGGSVISMVDSMINLSVSAKEATEEQAEKKALEIEKMFKIILDFDLKKLKYNNSDEFLKNASERMMICRLAMEADNTMSSYREMINLGKLKTHVDDEVLDEIKARTDVILGTATKTEKKLKIMSCEKYAIFGQETVDSLDDEFVDRKTRDAQRAMGREDISEEQRKNIKREYEYYDSIHNLRLAEISGLTFNRGDDPEAMLIKEREKINAKRKSSEKNEQEVDIDAIRSKMTSTLNGHASSVNTTVAGLAHQNEKAREYAKRMFPKHWEILLKDKNLRRQTIQKYYGEIHRGRKIPASMLDKIEKNFEKRFNTAKALDPTIMQASQNEHEKKVHEFCENHKEEITPSRQANSIFYLLGNLSEEDKVKKYNGAVELINYEQASHLDKLPQNEEERRKKIEEVKETNKELIDYIMGFDMTKLEFKNIEDITSNLEEINHFVQIMGEVQTVPTALYNLGILSDEEFIEMQSRVNVAMDYNMLFQNYISSHSSILYALMDTEDLTKVFEGDDIFYYQKHKNEMPTGDGYELLLDRYEYEHQLGVYKQSNELSQFNKALSILKRSQQTSYYKPGDTMENALKDAKQEAERKLNNEVKANLEKAKKKKQEELEKKAKEAQDAQKKKEDDQVNQINQILEEEQQSSEDQKN